MNPEEHKKRRAPRYPTFQTPGPPPPATVAAYRVASYADGLVGASPECDVLRPKWDSGLKWGGAIPQPGDWCWGAGVAGGVKWDGTFHRDLSRYSASGELFWSSYLKAGTAPGMKNGYWINFGSGWSHLHNDDPAQILSGAAQKLLHDAASGNWTLVIEATKFVTHEIINVWTGTKAGGSDPAGTYSRTSGLDPLAALTLEAVA